MNKSLTLGAVAALLMAGGQQVAAQPSECPITVSVAAIEATPGFSCTISSQFATATISDISISPLLTPTGHSLVFEGNNDVIRGFFRGQASFFSVFLIGTTGAVFPPGDVPNTFDYQISVSNISNAVLPPGLDFAGLFSGAATNTPPATGAVTTTMSLVGNVGSVSLAITAVPSAPFPNGMVTLDGDTTLRVSNSVDTAPGSNFNSDSLANNFGGTVVVGTPEPASLSLFGIGLAGLALARRRRSSRLRSSWAS